MDYVSYSIEKIAKWCDGKLVADNKNSELIKLAFDSRLVFDTNGLLFFALTSKQNDGHNFIKELYNKGVRNFVVNSSFAIDDNYKNANWIIVENTLDSLQKLALSYRKTLEAEVVGITGSNGKTIVKEWIAQFLFDDFSLARSPRSYNSQIGVPFSLWKIKDFHQIAIVEAGISKPNEMDKLQKMILPKIGILTNIGYAHQENFVNKEEILNEKLKLFKESDLILYSCDNEVIHSKIKEAYKDKKTLKWGRNSCADLQLISKEINSTTKLRFRWQNDEFEVDFQFNDSVSIENIMPVILFALYKGYAYSDIAKKVLQIEPVAMRMEQKDGINGCLILNDSYNYDILSLEVALNFLGQQATKKGMSRTLILSDIVQSGEDDEDIYPRIAKLVKSKNISRVIGVGESISNFASLFSVKDVFYSKTEEFINNIHNYSFKNEVVLIKGARSFSFEKISELLELKQHSTVLEINLNAFINNLKVLKGHLKPETKILGMVKAFGYGSGSYPISSTLQNNGASYLGVAFADEGVELRQKGITLPIIVMNPEIKSFNLMLEYDLEPEIYSVENLKEFAKVVREYGGEGKIHIKVDTGMNRFGFLPNQIEELILELKKIPYLKVVSVFSHLAASDEVEHDSFTKLQVEKFNQICDKIEQSLDYKFLKHILNSAGIERFPEYQFDMVRAGIGMYGFSADRDSNLQNVLTLKSYVSQIKIIDENEFVGYGLSEKLNKGDKLAVIPVGYADGLNRHLSNGKGELLIGDKLFPIVGRVCMDTCMINITGSDVTLNDEVIVFGDRYPASVMADKLGTISYEIMTNISQRVKRVYFKE